ncbi:TatD family hydrolase [Flammeovirgaceae bacterium SG7u.111]|nr:TatD family hydrolase [Flammeovirgaceae bacterium SG7u.132]WPO36860.1 TatD family hydrolase [Flammeovirgaceae bacterium SG7u.111]
MNMIDSHAHIYSDKFKNDVDEMIARSFDAGIDKILMPNIDHASIDRMLELEEKYPHQCYSMMGLHPCSVGKDFEKELYLVEDWLGKKDFLAVGEMGLDLYWDKTFFEQQKEAFRVQAGLAKKHKLPLVIHTRDSMEESIELLEELADENLTGVVHCFTGSVEDAERIIKTGFYLGIGGVSTFKNGGLDKVLPAISLNHLLLETDSPYLAPIPHRGKRNEPSYIQHIAKRIAEIKKVSLEEVAQKTRENTVKLFNIKDI